MNERIVCLTLTCIHESNYNPYCHSRTHRPSINRKFATESRYEGVTRGMSVMCVSHLTLRCIPPKPSFVAIPEHIQSSWLGLEPIQWLFLALFGTTTPPQRPCSTTELAGRVSTRTSFFSLRAECPVSVFPKSKARSLKAPAPRRAMSSQHWRRFSLFSGRP